MITTFLETGNGAVVIDGLEPQPISGFKGFSAAGFQSLMQLLLPRDAQAAIIEGTYSGEVLIQAYDTVSGDVFSQLTHVVIKHFGGVTTVVAVNNIALTQAGTLAAAASLPVVQPSGDIDFQFDTTTADLTRVSGIGIFITI